MKRKQWKAPKYFIELFNKKSELRKEIAAYTEMSVDYVSKNVEEFAHAIAHLPKHERQEVIQLMNEADILNDYLWAKFRYQNKVYVGNLRYDEKKQTIYLKEDLIKEAIFKLAELVGATK